jgi:hypothetical protein
MWAEYLDHLVQINELKTPAYWSAEDRSLLKNTSLHERAEALDETFQDEYEKIYKPFFSQSSLQCAPEKFTFELFKVC